MFKVATLRLRAQFIIALPRTHAKFYPHTVKVACTSSKLRRWGCVLSSSLPCQGRAQKFVVVPSRLCTQVQSCTLQAALSISLLRRCGCALISLLLLVVLLSVILMWTQVQVTTSATIFLSQCEPVAPAWDGDDFDLASMVLPPPTRFITCPVLPCQSLIFSMGSLPFQLASLPWVHCHFNWLPCHEFIAVDLAGFIASSWVHCLSNCDTAANQLLPCNYLWPNVIGHQIPFAFWLPICLLAPHLPFGAPVAFRCPHSIWCAVSIPMAKGHMGQCPAITPH